MKLFIILVLSIWTWIGLSTIKDLIEEYHTAGIVFTTLLTLATIISIIGIIKL